MNVAYIAGVMCGVLVVGIVCWLLLRSRKKGTGTNNEYDERQQAIRNECIRYAYVTLVCYLAAYLFLDSLGVKWCELGGGIFIGIVISLMVHVIYSIYKDAYFRVSDKPKSYVALFTFVGIVNLALGILRRVNGDSSGLVGYGDINLIVGIMLIIVMANIFVKMRLDKKAETE